MSKDRGETEIPEVVYQREFGGKEIAAERRRRKVAATEKIVVRGALSLLPLILFPGLIFGGLILLLIYGLGPIGAVIGGLTQLAGRLAQ